jgi:hypothetical protein
MRNGESGKTAKPKGELTIRRMDGHDQWHVPLIPGTSESEPPWVEVESSDARWDGYWFRIGFDGLGEVTSVEVHRQSEAPALTARMLQAVPLGAIERTARARIRDWTQSWVAGRQQQGLRTDTPLEDWLRSFEGSRRDPARDIWLAKIADRYVETLGDHQQRESLRQEFAVSWEYVPELIAEARQRGLLTPTTRGKSGGILTPLAIELLGRQALPNVKAPDDRAVQRELRFQELHRAFESGEIDSKEWQARFKVMIAGSED